MVFPAQKRRRHQGDDPVRGLAEHREGENRSDDFGWLAELLSVDKEITEAFGSAHELGGNDEHGGDPARIAAVRAAAPYAILIVDANEGWNEGNLAANLAACADAGVVLVEQPLPEAQDGALATITFWFTATLALLVTALPHTPLTTTL